MRFGLMFLYPVNSVNVGGAAQTAATNTPATPNKTEEKTQENKIEKISIFSSYDTSQDGKVSIDDGDKHKSIFQLNTERFNSVAPTNISDNATNISSIRKIANAQMGGVTNKFSEMINSFSFKVGSFTTQNKSEVQSKTSELNQKVENQIAKMSDKYNQMVFDLYTKALNDVAQQIGDSNPEIPQGGENDKIFVDKFEQPEGVGTGRNEDGTIKHNDGSEQNIKINGKKPEVKANGDNPEVKANGDNPEVKANGQETNVQGNNKDNDISDETMALEEKCIEKMNEKQNVPEGGGTIGSGTKKKYGTCYKVSGQMSFAEVSAQLGVDIPTLQKYNKIATQEQGFKEPNDIYVPFGAEKTEETSTTSTIDAQNITPSAPNTLADTPIDSALQNITFATPEPTLVTGTGDLEIADVGEEITISTDDIPTNVTGMDTPESVETETVETFVSTDDIEENITELPADELEVVDDSDNTEVIIGEAEYTGDNITGIDTPEIAGEGDYVPENSDQTPSDFNSFRTNNNFNSSRTSSTLNGRGLPNQGTPSTLTGSGFGSFGTPSTLTGNGLPNQDTPSILDGNGFGSFDKFESFDGSDQIGSFSGLDSFNPQSGFGSSSSTTLNGSGLGNSSRIGGMNISEVLNNLNYDITNTSNQFKELGFDNDTADACALKHEQFMKLINKQKGGAELTPKEQDRLNSYLDLFKQLKVNCDENGNISRM